MHIYVYILCILYIYILCICYLLGFLTPEGIKLLYWVREHFWGYQMKAPGAREPNQEEVESSEMTR